MVMSQFQHLSPWHQKSYSGSPAAIVLETAVPDDAAARKMVLIVYQPAETAEASHVRIVSRMLYRVGKTQIPTSRNISLKRTLRPVTTS